jgi:hypothetical protein
MEWFSLFAAGLVGELLSGAAKRVDNLQQIVHLIVYDVRSANAIKRT